MYSSLRKSDLSGTASIDSNDVEVYSLSCTSSFNTEWFPISKETKIITIDLIPTSLNGTVTCKVQHSRNKTNIYDLINSSYATVELSLDNTNTADYITTENFPLGFFRVVVTNGTNSTGSLTILVDK